ncbi:hypothetical protein HOP50_02g14210 [Chloropicon primus]|uniref:Uncharacterized protein n=1 Tax=Chloropicon primus TaxID=1764295 RepID=A0A5B8MGV0_9CHLO|nr:hypothetical protein A3770_02p14330 [Chloropicon primus]UPQ98123.1 hypothetical protein HOP50_02g14210 [Chloropicon primus]|eukprot:QDZ18915.1 hypothetical protein A3770_02p14330 [Chloropicon primus]
MEAVCERLKGSLEEGDESQVHEEVSGLLRRIEEEESIERKQSDLDYLVGDRASAKALYLCASVSDRCRKTVASIGRCIVGWCSGREVRAFIGEVVRELATDGEVKWESLVCALSTTSSALGVIKRKKYLHYLSSCDLHTLVCASAADALAEGGDGEGEGGRAAPASLCCEAATTVLEDFGVACDDLASIGPSADKDEAARRLSLHCLCLLGSMYVTVGQEHLEGTWNAWTALAIRSLGTLGVKHLGDLGKLVLADEDGASDDEGESLEDAHFIGACLVAESFLDSAVAQESGEGSLTCPDLMHMASTFFAKMLAFAEHLAESQAPAAVSRALHLLYSFVAHIENSGGLSEASPGQRTVMGCLIRMMSHFPDRPVRTRAKFCMTALLKALNDKQRCQCMAGIIESCQYPSISATLMVGMKDEVAAVWPTKERPESDSAFLGPAALGSILGPLYSTERITDLGQRKDYLDEKSEVVVASLNALRFVLLKEQNQGASKAVMLSKDCAKRLLVETLPCIRGVVQTALREQQKPGAPEFGPNRYGRFKCTIGDDWQSQKLMNLHAIEMVMARLDDILEGYIKSEK